MHIFHIATLADWEQARTAGAYTTSTRGRTLAEVGFIHAARADQVAGVRTAYFDSVTEPLVLLTIDTDLLGAPWSMDPVGDDSYPHVHGPLDPTAVVAVAPLE